MWPATLRSPRRLLLVMKDAPVLTRWVTICALFVLAGCARIDEVLYPEEEVVEAVVEEEVPSDLDDGVVPVTVAPTDLGGCGGMCEHGQVVWDLSLASTTFDVDVLAESLGMEPGAFVRSAAGLPLLGCIDFGPAEERETDSAVGEDGVRHVLLAYSRPNLASRLLRSAAAVVAVDGERLADCSSGGRTIRRLVELGDNGYRIDVTEAGGGGSSFAVTVVIRQVDTLRVLVSIERDLSSIR
jgi:hypothetical protein